MKNKIMTYTDYIIPIILIILAVFLFLDASIFALYPADRATGRSRGCYTMIEFMLGVKQPSWIRSAELIGAFGLFLCIVGIFVRFYLLKRKMKTSN